MFLIFFSDVPTPPQDMKITDIFATKCKISWKTPQDHGGSPITQYIIEHQDMGVKGKITLTFTNFIYLLILFRCIPFR